MDEDKELISVDVDLELAEALRFIVESDSFLIVEDKTITGSTYQFIDDLPLMRSQITSTGPSDPVEESTVLEVFEFQFPNKDLEICGGEEEKDQRIDEERKVELEDLGFRKERQKEYEIRDSFGQEVVDVEQEQKIEDAMDFEELQLSVMEIEKPGDVKDDAGKTLAGDICQIPHITKGNSKMPEVKHEGSKRLSLYTFESSPVETPLPEIKLIKEEPMITIEKIRGIIQEELRKSTIDSRAVHNVRCYNCKVHPVRDIVYECKSCIGYYLCMACEVRIAHQHHLLKIKKPITQDPLEELTDKICEKLQFKDKEKVIKAIIANDYNYHTTIEALLTH